MKKLFPIILFLSIHSLGSAQKFNFEIDSVDIIGENIISSPDFEFNFTSPADLSVAYFSKALLPDWRRISIVYSKTKNGKWQQPVLAPFSGKYRDADPFISPLQDKLYFISDRPSKYQKKKSDYSFWYVTAPFDKAKEPILVEGSFYAQFANNPVYPSVSHNGNLYFSAVDSTGDSDIYMAKEENGTYGSAVRLSFNDPKIRDIDPVIAPDESFIIFSCAMRKGFGGSDIYISFNDNGKWTEPQNLGKLINTPGNEGQAGISADGKTIYFTSIRNKILTDYAPRATTISQKEFESEMRSPFNGLPNIWKASLKIETN